MSEGIDPSDDSGSVTGYLRSGLHKILLYRVMTSEPISVASWATLRPSMEQWVMPILTDIYLVVISMVIRGSSNRDGS